MCHSARSAESPSQEERSSHIGGGFRVVFATRNDTV